MKHSLSRIAGAALTAIAATAATIFIATSPLRSGKPDRAEPPPSSQPEAIITQPDFRPYIFEEIKKQGGQVYQDGETVIFTSPQGPHAMTFHKLDPQSWGYTDENLFVLCKGQDGSKRVSLGLPSPAGTQLKLETHQDLTGAESYVLWVSRKNRLNSDFPNTLFIPATEGVRLCDVCNGDDPKSPEEIAQSSVFGGNLQKSLGNLAPFPPALPKKDGEHGPQELLPGVLDFRLPFDLIERNGQMLPIVPPVRQSLTEPVVHLIPLNQGTSP